ncbi:retrovirus-related pol polyprotein from transposon TNT 1-94, partial [Tanacetum coccineum]
RHHIAPIGDLNGVSIALVARSGVISKSTDKIFISYGGLSESKDLNFTLLVTASIITKLTKDFGALTFAVGTLSGTSYSTMFFLGDGWPAKFRSCTRSGKFRKLEKEVHVLIGIEPQFENIIKNGPFIPMTAGQRKLENQWTGDERRAANLDQRLKSLIMFVLPNNQMNSVLNCLIAKSTWDDLILYHKGSSDVKESRVMNLKFCYNTFKFKKGESLTQTFTRYKALMNELLNDGIKLSKLKINTGFINGLPKKWLNRIYETEKNKSLVSATLLSTTFFSSSIVHEEDTRSSHEYLNDLEEEYQARALLAKSKRFFKKVSTYQSPFQPKPFSSPQHKPELRLTKDFEAKYNKVKAKLALLSSSASASKASMVKNKGLIAEAYEWDEEEVSSDDNKMVEVKLLMALAEENDVVSKEGARNGVWVKISMRKVHSLLEIEDNDDRKVCLDYLCTDLNYVEEQRSNLLSKHRNLVHELNTCKEQLLVLKQVKLDFLTMQHVNTEILKENKNLRTELKELKAITKTWLNSSNKVNQCITEQIPSQKKRILKVDQLIEDPSSSGQKDLVFVKSSSDDTKVTIPSVKRPWLSKDEGFILPNHDTADESSVCSTPLPPLKKLDSVEPISGPKIIKSILRYEKTDHRTCDHAEYTSTMNMSQHLKSLGRASSRSKIPRPSKRFFPPCTHCDCIDHLSDKCLYYPICGLCRSYDHDTNGHNKIISLEREINLRNPQHTFKRCEVCGSSTHTTTDHYDIEWFKRGEALQAKKLEALKSTRAESLNANRSKTPTKSGCSRHTTGVKSYLHKYMEQSGPKVFDEKRGTIFNSNKEVVMIAPRISSPYTPEQNGVAERKNRTLIEAARTMLSGSIFSKQYWTEVVATACYTQNRSTNMKIHLKTPYEIFYHLGKFDEKANDGYLLRYSLISKAFRVFNTRRQQTKETYHITFDESPDDIKFLKPSVDDINIAETERYPPDEYLHPYEPSQRYQTNSNDVSFIEPYEYPEPVVLETKISSDQNGQTDQNDHNDQNDQSAQNNEILNDDHSEHSNHTNDEQIIDNILNTEDIQISEHLSSPSVEDTSVQNTTLVPTPPLPIPSMSTLVPQDIWSQDKHIELVNIIGNPGAGMLTRSMAKQLSAASAHEFLFVDFLSEEEPKNVFEAPKHPRWVDAMQDELNQFAKNKVWTLVPAPYGKTIIGSK